MVKPAPFRRRLAKCFSLAALAFALAGCNLVVMSPSGDIAVQQKNLIIASTALMLIVIIPVIALTFVFAWRYRSTNTEATYDPDWHHSTQLEVIIWTVPLLIVIALGAMTWMSTHTLDPFRPISRLGPNRPVPPDVRPLEIQAVSLDWKWLFIYPEYGIATVNEVAAPVDRPIVFRITSSSVWNTFYVPALAGMIYAMPGMETKLNAVINREGAFRGLSAHYSGTGFSRMNFAFQAQSQEAFDAWVARAKSAGNTLDRATYQVLERPSEAEPVRHFGTVENGIYDAILGMCVRPGQMCISEMHHIDRSGGAGHASDANRRRLHYDNRRQETEAPAATVPASGRPARSDAAPEGTMPRSGEGGPSGSPAPGSGTAPPTDRGPAPSQLHPQPGSSHRH